jgi:hypothetical protein
MNKSIRNMNRTIGEAELSETVPATLSWELLCARNRATTQEERDELDEQIRQLRLKRTTTAPITLDSRRVLKSMDDPRTAEQTLVGWNEIVERHAPKPMKLTPKAECDHKREHAVIGGMQCPSCKRRREPANDFEKRLISRLTPRGSGYVNYK